MFHFVCIELKFEFKIYTFEIQLVKSSQDFTMFFEQQVHFDFHDLWMDFKGIFLAMFFTKTRISKSQTDCNYCRDKDRLFFHIKKMLEC